MPRRANKLRTNDPNGMRAKVLDAAAHAFQAAGYGATSMQDLRQAASVSGGALHHHFPTKKHLGLAVIAERVSAEVGKTWIDTVRNAPTAAEGILAVFETTIADLDRQGFVVGCPLGNLAVELSRADDDFRFAVASEYRAWRSAIAERLRADIAGGGARFAKDDPEGFADMVVAMFSGAMGICKAEQTSAALSACARRLRAMMAG